VSQFLQGCVGAAAVVSRLSFWREFAPTGPGCATVLMAEKVCRPEVGVEHAAGDARRDIENGAVHVESAPRARQGSVAVEVDEAHPSSAVALVARGVTAPVATLLLVSMLVHKQQYWCRARLARPMRAGVLSGGVTGGVAVR
jgi:hypothetical protein